MTVKSIVLSTMAACLMPFASARENTAQSDLLFEVLLSAYNGGAQTYAEKTKTPANLLTKEELRQVQTQLQQLQVLVTDETGELDINRVMALLNLASQSDAEFMGIEGAKLQAPLQMLQSVSEQGKRWQDALLELKTQNQPLIESTLNELTTTIDDREGESIASALSILLGAGMALEEMVQSQPSDQFSAQMATPAGVNTTRADANALSKEVDFLKALAEKDRPSLLHTNIHHQFAALVSRLKIAYADSTVKEQTAVDTQNTILAVKYFLSQADGQLTQSEYEQLLLWLDRLGSPYQEVRQQVVNQHVDLTKDTK